MVDVVAHTAAAKVKVNGIELVYDTFGEPDAPAFLLVMGLGCQMIDWKDDFCSLLATRGFHVIRFDNRDVGQSTTFEAAGHPDIAALLEAMGRGETITSAYLLRDLVADALGLLDLLGIEKAHVAGFSMGGMIAQLIAAHHPERVLTLTSMMSTTGEPGLPASTPEAWACLTMPHEKDLQRFIDQYMYKWSIYTGPHYPLESDAKEHAAHLFARGIHTAGRDRQLAAILASGSRKEALASVTCPSLVIHGDSDPVVRIEGAMATANAIKGARLMTLEGAGHYLARALWPRVVDALAQHAGH